ncbi:MAG: hypothetical protein ABH804_02565 [archaeon]
MEKGLSTILGTLVLGTAIAVSGCSGSPLQMRNPEGEVYKKYNPAPTTVENTNANRKIIDHNFDLAKKEREKLNDEVYSLSKYVRGDIKERLVALEVNQEKDVQNRGNYFHSNVTKKDNLILWELGIRDLYSRGIVIKDKPTNHKKIGYLVPRESLFPEEYYPTAGEYEIDTGRNFFVPKEDMDKILGKIKKIVENQKAMKIKEFLRDYIKSKKK